MVIVMKKLTLLMTALITLGFAPLTVAEERPEHFEGKPAATLEQAVTNFSEYNKKLSALLDQDKLSPENLQQIHKLTYTLENALAKINSEFTGLAKTLESIHVASEKTDAKTVRMQGQSYLNTAGKVIK